MITYFLERTTQVQEAPEIRWEGKRGHVNLWRRSIEERVCEQNIPTERKNISAALFIVSCLTCSHSNRIKGTLYFIRTARRKERSIVLLEFVISGEVINRKNPSIRPQINPPGALISPNYHQHSTKNVREYFGSQKFGVYVLKKQFTECMERKALECVIECTMGLFVLLFLNMFIELWRLRQRTNHLSECCSSHIFYFALRLQISHLRGQHNQAWFENWNRLQ